MAPPINIDAANAIDILSLPFSSTQNVHDAGITYTVWYKYTGSVPNEVIGFRFYGIINGGAGTYRPFTTVFSGPVDFIGSTGNNLNSQLPINIGTTYYFRITPNAGNPNPAILNIDLIRAPQNAVLAGDIFISAASITPSQIAVGFTGLPGGYIRTTTQQIVNFQQFFIPGEQGDILPNGIMLYVDEFSVLSPPPPPPLGNYWLNLYDANFVLLTRVVFYSPITPPLVRTHNPSNKFYVLDPGGSGNFIHFANVTDGGVISARTPLTGFQGATALAVNNAENVLYIVGVGSSLNSNIKRWSIPGSTFLSDLSAIVVGYKVTDILVLSDDTIIASYFKSTTPRSSYAVHYNTAGTVLNTYAPIFGATLTSINPRLGYSANSPEAFWFFNHLTTGFSDIRLIRVSDGVELVTSLTPDSTNTQIEQINPPLTVTSDSCPIIEIRESVVPVGTIIIIKTTVPSSNPTVFTFNANGLTPTSFTLSHGQIQVYNDVPIGVYGIEEILPPGWSVIYNVSDGSPINALSLQEGETITINVINTLNPNERSGIYKIVPGKRNDTLWNDLSAETTTVVKIPNPYIKTGLIGE
jgi:hypothetical protein